ncbi:MAG: hypothetical protein KDD82_10920 [Planctomycetes bacterium]|nr:hypothetical protein [Planctomycetota bacterium]
MTWTQSCLALALCCALTAEAKTEATLTGQDGLAKVGQPVTLKAKLERSGILGINPDVSEEKLDFFLVSRDGKELSEAQFIATGKTDDDGTASVDYTPDETGLLLIEARVRRGSDYIAFPAEILIGVPDPKRPILLVQVDQTVSEATNLDMFRGKDVKDIAAVDGAKQVLELLASPYQLVYLTDLEASFTSGFKAWLQQKGLPRAPVLFWDLSRSLSHATYMQSLIERLSQDFPQIVAGVGGQTVDGLAYLEHGAAGIVLADEPDEDDWRVELLRASSWQDVLGHLALIYEAEKLLKVASGEDSAKAKAAIDTMCRVGLPGKGYVHRFRRSADPSLALAANLVSGKISANEAFAESLDASDPARALASLLAAWRYGEASVVGSLYRERGVGVQAPIPPVERAEVLNRSEPEPGRVVFKVRLLAGSDALQRQVTVVDTDGAWKIAGVE